MEYRRMPLKNSLYCFIAALIWGVAFTAQSLGMDYLGPFSFTAGRSLLGASVLFPVVCLRKRREQGETHRVSLKTKLAGGICCALALGTATSLQQIGIQYTTVGKAGFITTLYIILVPVFGIFLGRKAAARVWAGALMAVAGLYFLCVDEAFTLSPGDVYILICAFIFAVHIMLIDYFSKRMDGVELSFLQFFFAGVITMVIAAITEKPSISDFAAGILPLAYAGIMSSGVAYTFQILGQKDGDPTVACLILSLESVISVLAGWVFLKQSLSIRELTGCGVVFAAVVLVQLPGRKERQHEAGGLTGIK